MIYKFEYSDEINRTAIILANKNKILVEDHNLIVGNFLIFSDVKSVADGVKEVNDNIMVVMNGLTDIYMAQLGL